MAAPHPLAPLSRAEMEKARDAIVKLHGRGSSLYFRSVYLHEPPRTDLISFLQTEHEGALTDSTPRPPRLAVVQYDVIHTAPQQIQYTQSIVDLNTLSEVERRVAGPGDEASFPPYVALVYCSSIPLKRSKEFTQHQGRVCHLL